MEHKLLSAFCLAAMMALATCKGAVAPAYALSEEENRQAAVNTYSMFYSAENVCDITFMPSLKEQVTNNALEYVGSIEALNAYAQEESVKLVLTLPLMGVSVKEFCGFLYTELKKEYGFNRMIDGS